MFCQFCGTKIEKGVKFCPSCGQSVKVSSVTKTSKAMETGETVEEDDMFVNAYISGKPSNNLTDEHLTYYKNNFKKFDLNGITRFKLTWNWSAFLLGGWHLIYRKSYIIGVISIVLFSVLPGWGWLLSFAIGFCANYIYYRRYIENMEKFRAAYPNDVDKQISLIAEEGGVNTFVKGLIIAYFVIYCIFWGFIGLIVAN